MSVKRYNLFLLSLLLALTIPVNLFGQSKLQQYLDGLAGSQSASTRASSTPTVIDLSEFDSDVTETLYVRNGINVEFQNGTLIRNCDGALVNVEDNSTLTIGEGVELKISSISYNPVVNIDGGRLICKAGLINAISSDGSRIEMVIDGMRVLTSCYYAVTMEQESDEFILDGGKINHSITGSGKITIKKGEVSSMKADKFILNMNGTCKIENIDVLNKNTVSIYNKVSNKINIRCKESYGYVIAQGDNGYTLTQNDVDNISVTTTVWPMQTYPNPSYRPIDTKLEDNKIVLIEKPITDASSLQYRLDLIAQTNRFVLVNNSELTTLEIPEQGIEIDVPIYFHSRCLVKLTGGPIRIPDALSSIISGNSEYTFVSEEGSKAVFQDIILNYNNNSQLKRSLFEVHGALIMGDNVTFTGINEDISLPNGIFNLYEGCDFSFQSGKVELNNTTVFYGTGDVKYSGTGYVMSRGKPVADVANFYCSGGFVGSGYREYAIKAKTITVNDGSIRSFDYPLFKCNDVTLTGGTVGGVSMSASNSIKVFPSKDTKLIVEAPIIVKNKMELCGELDALNVEFFDENSYIEVLSNFNIGNPIEISYTNWEGLIKKPIIRGTASYTIKEEDLNKFKFIDCNYKASLDKTGNYIYLKKKSLNEFLDEYSGGDGTAEEPVAIDIPDEDDIDDDVHFPNGLQGVLDGLGNKENDDNIPKVLNIRKGNVYVDNGSTITIRNYILDGCSNGRCIYVDGTLVLDANVNIRYFSDYFIHLRKGGSVIWRGGRTELIDKVIYNEGGKLTIDDGEINSNNGNKDNAITNYGEMHINGGTINGTIYSYTDFHLCGCASVGNVYLRGGSTLFLTERMTNKVKINIFIEGTVKSGTIIVTGADEYRFTENDLAMTELELPDGYEWEYDKTLNAIVIKSSTGINGVEMDEQSNHSTVYSMKGIKIGTTADKDIMPDGIYIIDGKKTVLRNEK